jgi:tagaturonate epimerase
MNTHNFTQLTSEVIQHYSPGSIYEDSFRLHGDNLYFLTKQRTGKKLFILCPKNRVLSNYVGHYTEITIDNQPQMLFSGELVPQNARALRSIFTNLTPTPFGIEKSFGFGDRLGCATSGHAMAVQNTGIKPVFAQQSIREMDRSARTPQQVIDDATWGAFQAGWQELVGADADHLKNIADIDRCIGVGFSFFTIDPGYLLERNIPRNNQATQEKIEQFQLIDGSEITLHDLEQRHLHRIIDLPHFHQNIDRINLVRFYNKYKTALILVINLYRYLESKLGKGKFDFEVSLDETQTPTRPVDHYLFVSELISQEISITSLAPRFPGKFEKGVDYIGDLNYLTVKLRQHSDIACSMGPYKISLHSGSDKFRIYPIAASVLGNLVHVKTAGTSYLEALRVVAVKNPSLFRDLFDFCKTQYPIDRQSYHVSADIDRIGDISDTRDDDLPGLLNNFDARQILHVTFGSVMTVKDQSQRLKFRPEIEQILSDNEMTYNTFLRSHFKKHLFPFSREITQ